MKQQLSHTCPTLHWRAAFLCILSISAPLASTSAALADEAAQISPAERLADIQKEVADAEAEMMAAYKAASTSQDEAFADKLSAACRTKKLAAFAEASKIAQAAPESEVARDAITWLLDRPMSYYTDDFVRCLNILAERHAADPKIGRGLANLAYCHPTPNDVGFTEMLALFHTVIARNPDSAVRAQAAMGLAWVAKRRYDHACFLGEEDTDKLRADAEQQWYQVLQEYGDCANLRTRGARAPSAKVAGEAKTELFELRSLEEGQPAPEIVGEDLAGQKFKLSDYRGKTTLLVFWASWCGACMADVPHERELVAHFRNRPFALIGVNGDEDLATVSSAVKENDISWRNFWNGKDGAGGPIARAWNVRGWPTVYVIDHKGIIRHKRLRDETLDEALEKLVAEAERDAARK